MMLLALLKVMSAYAGLMTNARVSIQTQSLALRALRKRKPQETQALANASACVSCGFRLRNAHNARNASDCD